MWPRYCERVIVRAGVETTSPSRGGGSALAEVAGREKSGAVSPTSIMTPSRSGLSMWIFAQLAGSGRNFVSTARGTGVCVLLDRPQDLRRGQRTDLPAHGRTDFRRVAVVHAVVDARQPAEHMRLMREAQTAPGLRDSRSPWRTSRKSRVICGHFERARGAMSELRGRGPVPD